ncbi:hypothetical protein HC823_01235 [Candidatus Gracilibacteria bacterium]|nr:hypothetical protein [Candidatus Gracilibacteria bacterium]
MHTIETKHLDPTPAICTLQNGVFLNEYEATPFLTEDISKEMDIREKKNPFYEKAEAFLKSLDVEKVYQKRAYKILVELVENIYRYRIPAEKGLPVFESAYIREEDDFIYIGTANTVDETSKQKLEKKLGNLNALLHENISEALEIIETTRRKVLCHGIINEQGGAGLGFFGYCKKTVTPFKYSFSPTENKESLYQFQIETKIALEQASTQKRIERAILHAS